MKNTKEIAQFVMERRNRMSTVIMQGELMAEIGSEGLREALERRWVVANHESGYLQVTNDMAKVQEIREFAERVEETCKKDGVDICKKDGEDDDGEEGEEKGEDGKPKKKEWKKPWETHEESHKFSLDHSQRDVSKSLLSEIAAPGTGHDSPRGPAPAAAPPTSAVPPRQSAAPNSNAPRNPNTSDVGDSVMVTHEGRQYQGRVAAKTQDGRYKLSFGASRPPVDIAYAPEEMRFVAQAQVQPGA